ncbi:CatA-like O-acetyltransferase [Acanthopleuribacter pedis]|uniref:Chloramphenicol acetyltransferase n=1 Tax=Acanthopleuribacter pedis TaxID=442870 RepID=A0A8J7QBP1_9BACT|nr:CatA-like O-acetyltransferase [Acanthopleuribacter pedis]MBO1320749.1 hypothetical protein [Acanthopleuribacter pedis]
MAHQPFDLTSWPRRWAFDFFKDYEQPCFNICGDLDIGRLPEVCREGGHSFFLVSLFAAVETVNQMAPFRLRLDGEGVRLYDRIHAGSAVLREDTSFDFCYFPFEPKLETFLQEMDQTLACFHRREPRYDFTGQDDVLFFSVIPWISFTSFSHASTRALRSDIPRITYGKFHQRDGRFWLPLSVEVHHALMDGYHVGMYFQTLSQKLQDLAVTLS